MFTDKAHMPQTTLKNAVAYEDWIAEADGDFAWKTFDENTAAAMCYTSGTTGDPKGVLYSHRSNVLHALMANSGDALGTSAGDTMLPVVPLFHANGWGIAFSAPSMGTKLVMPGAEARRRVGLRAAGDREGDLHRRRADGLADAAQPHGRQQSEAAASANGGVRRLGDAALDDQGVRRHGRRGASTPGA